MNELIFVIKVKYKDTFDLEKVKIAVQKIIEVGQYDANLTCEDPEFKDEYAEIASGLEIEVK